MRGYLVTFDDKPMTAELGPGRIGNDVWLIFTKRRNAERFIERELDGFSAEYASHYAIVELEFLKESTQLDSGESNPE